MIIDKSKRTELFKDAASLLIGSLVYAVSVNSFTAPNQIAPGGVTGISTVINYLTRFPIGTMMLILNIPILTLGVIKLGIKFLTKTIISTVLISIFIDVLSIYLPAYHGNKILAALYGGVLTGASLAIIFLRGGTTGGTDIIARLINRKYPYLSMGRVILIIDCMVITFAAIAYRNLESALYAMIAIYTGSKVIDSIMYGSERGKVILIISQHPEEVAKEIMKHVKRGVTLLDGSGAYTRERKDVVMCAVRRNETAKLHKVVKEVDGSAFIVALEASEILGEGFKSF